MVKEVVIKKSGRRILCDWNASKGSDELLIRLVEKGASVDVLGFFRLSGNENRSIKLRVRHEAPNTESTVIIRGLIYDKATANVLESVEIENGATGSKTHVEARAILLSGGAGAQLEPHLEIAEDDVEATHAAHIGPLEEDEIFYLMSRGILRVSAERLLIESFLYPVRDAIADDNAPLL